MGKTAVKESGIAEIKPDKTRVSICIPTYKRIPLLKKLLGTLDEQVLPEGVVLEIIIVDNDAAKTAEETVMEYSKNSIHECNYYSQPKKNISITRNMAVKKATGQYILFIDDDNYASPNLVKEHLEALKKYDADITFGLVLPDFHDRTPEWLKDKDFYYSPIGESGSNVRFTWGGNTMAKAFIFKQFDEPFDVQYGITGGEDSYLYSQLIKQGYKLKYSREAVTTEFLPPERTTHRYLFKRAFKGGNLWVRRIVDENKSKRLMIYLEQFFKGSLQILFYSAKFIVSIFSRKKRLKALLKIYSNLGKVIAITGYEIQAYK